MIRRSFIVGLARRLALAACLLLTPAWAAAEPVAHIVGPTQNAPGNLVVLRTDGTVGTGHSWKIIPPEAEQFFLPILDSSGNQAAVFSTNKAGTYTFILTVSENGLVDWEARTIQPSQTAIAVHTLVQGKPGPGPGPDPGPDPPPVTVGKRTLLIVRETADSTPAMARMVTALRQPPHATYITSKGHSLAILDDDSVDENGQPTPRLEQWRPHFQGMTLPVLFVIDSGTNTILHKQSLAADATADSVMQIVRAHGG